MPKTTILQLVAANAAQLRELTHSQLFAWSREHGLDNRAAFSAFKKALRTHGIDYNALREAVNSERAASLAKSCTHEITLITDAKARCERFAICNAAGDVIWHGRFFDGEGREQSAAELECAKKAIWLGGKVRAHLGAPAVRLRLKVDAQWLCTLSGKAALLRTSAQSNAIDLAMEWIPGAQNPADKWTTARGFRKWQDTPLESLAITLNP